MAKSSPRETRGQKLIKWGMFAVLVALLPFGLQLLFGWTKNQPINWKMFCDTFKEGDLLLVAAALAADATGEVIVTTKVQGKGKWVSSGGCLLIAVAASAWYGQIRTTDVAQLSQDRICEGSIVLFVLTLLLAVVCKVL